MPPGSSAAASRSRRTAAGSRSPSIAARSTPARRLAPVCELEYELKGGEPRALIEFGKEAVREHGAWLSTMTKAARGDRLARGETEGEAVKARPPLLDRGMDGAQVFRATLRACLDQVLANASEIGAGSRAAEAIHQLRVGIRRARTAWRELAPLCPVAGADWEAPLVEAFRALGAFRDRHTVVASLQARLAARARPNRRWRPPTKPSRPIRSRSSGPPPSSTPCSTPWP